MENPRMSEIMNFNETHYSVRQNGGSTGSSSIRNMFPLHPVTLKRLESPYGAKYIFLAENPVFQFFGLLAPYWPFFVPTPRVVGQVPSITSKNNILLHMAIQGVLT